MRTPGSVSQHQSCVVTTGQVLLRRWSCLFFFFFEPVCGWFVAKFEGSRGLATDASSPVREMVFKPIRLQNVIPPHNHTGFSYFTAKSIGLKRRPGPGATMSFWTDTVEITRALLIRCAPFFARREESDAIIYPCLSRYTVFPRFPVPPTDSASINDVVTHYAILQYVATVRLHNYHPPVARPRQSKTKIRLSRYLPVDRAHLHVAP